MYRYILVISLFLSANSFAQLHSVGFHGGAMGTSAGKNFANTDSKFKVDFIAGLNYQYRFTSHLTLGANIEYTQYGSQVNVQFTDWMGNLIAEDYSSWDWNYISVPLIVGFEMGGKVRVKPKAAIIPSILARSVYNFKAYEGSTFTPFKTSYYSDANKFDLGGLVGVDVSVPFHAGVLFAGFDFRYSITKLNADNLFPTSFYDTYRNKGIIGTVGVRFNIGNPEGEGPKDIIDDPVD